MVDLDAEDNFSDTMDEPDIVKQNGKRKSEQTADSGKKRLKTKSLYRQPTANELNRLQETENLFNSNLFRLQIEEVLDEVKVSEKISKRFNEWFSSLNDYLLTISEDGTEYDLSEQVLKKKLKVKLPISSELNKTKCMFRFIKFNKIEVTGSYALGCAINSKLKVDLQITVPAETYTKNDSINYRYHKKRAAYLAFIASHLNKSDLVGNIKYLFTSSESRPTLLITPKGKLSKHLTVSLNLVCESEAYKLHRFSPQRNNLREQWMFSSETIGNQSDVGPRTPYYNNSVLYDLTAHENQEFLSKLLINSENLKQAIILLKIWIHQRKLRISGHIVSLLVAYLVHNKRINNIMSSYQIVRNVWISLKSSEWDVKGISLYKGPETTPPLEDFHKQFPVVFLDITGYYNICYQMSRGTYSTLRRESALAVEILDNGKINGFIPLFMTQLQPLSQFDHILKFKDVPQLITSVTEKASKESQLNYGVDRLSLVVDEIYNLLTKGLTCRVEQITEILEADYTWNVKKTPEKAKLDGYQQNLSFGLIVNAENSISLVDKGPQANLPEAEKFREFWGDKSELRRFQDGSITEACVWDADSLVRRRTVVQQIVDYLMQYTYGLPPSSTHHIYSQLDGLLSLRRVSGDSPRFVEECSVEVTRGVDELRRHVRGLKDLPLDVSAVYGVSSVFSYSAPLPAVPRAAPRAPRSPRGAPLLKLEKEVVPAYVPVVKAVIELGHSGKWPGELQAFHCLKAAFHLQISDQLHKQFQLATQAYPTHIDVLKNGIVYRLAIAHPKEITLLRKEIDNGVVKMSENEESIRLQRDTVLLPRLRGALHGLHQKHPAFGPTACVFQRWLSSHLLSRHFPDIVAQLLTAYVFLQPAPYRASSRIVSSFVRVLRLLVERDWARDTLVLDFNGDLTREQLTTLEHSVPSPRPALPLLTSLDAPLPGVWTQHHPTQNVLSRTIKLARCTLEYIEREVVGGAMDNLLAAFIPSYAGYDVLITLRPTAVPLRHERVDCTVRPKKIPRDQTTDSETLPAVEFNAVERYVDELTAAFSEFALFFYDQFGGEVIAVLWKPDIDEEKEFLVSSAQALKPVAADGVTKYKVNKEALVEDFRTMGQGIVQHITVN